MPSNYPPTLNSNTEALIDINFEIVELSEEIKKQHKEQWQTLDKLNTALSKREKLVNNESNFKSEIRAVAEQLSNIIEEY